MSEEIKLEEFVFESREVYDRAEKELGVIHQLEQGIDLTDAKNALRVYNKAVTDRVFETAVGYCFLHDLRKCILEAGITENENLEEIPVCRMEQTSSDTISKPPMEAVRYKRLYEGQIFDNKKYKISLVVMGIVLIAFVFINFRFEYSIFTYFTNYKANMEEEIVNKYEEWQHELEEKEKQLNEQMDGME